MNYQPDPIHLFRQHLQYIGSGRLSKPDLEKLYGKHIFVYFDGHAVAIPFDAQSYNALCDFMNTI